MFLQTNSKSSGRFGNLLFTILILILLAGCGRGDQVPNVPDPYDEPPALSGASALLGLNTPGCHVLWGLWHVSIDPETGECEILRERHAGFHLNITQLLQPPNPMGLSITINDFNLLEATVDLDLIIKHPVPGSNLRGFDIRGIVMGSGDTLTGEADPGIVYAAHTGLRMLNADGYSRWWNGQEFTTPGLYGFTPGLLGPSTFVSPMTLNPYKYYADVLGPTDPVIPAVNMSNRGTFSTDLDPPQLSRNMVLKFPIVDDKPVWLFQYAVDASWGAPTGNSPKPKPIDDFPITTNCPEAFHIEVDTSASTVYYVDEFTYGGDLVLDIEVFDWQIPSNPLGAAGEIEAVMIESPTLFTGVQTIPGIFSFPGSVSESAIYTITIPDVTPTGSDNQEVLISVTSVDPNTYAPPVPWPDYPEDASLAAYRIEPISCLHKVINVEVPNGGEEWLAGSDQTVEWTWVGDIPQVDLLLSLDGGAAFPIELVTDLANTGSWNWIDIPEEYATDEARIKILSSGEPAAPGISDNDFKIVNDPCSPDMDPPDTTIVSGCEDPPLGVYTMDILAGGEDLNDCTSPEELRYEVQQLWEGNIVAPWSLQSEPEIHLADLDPGEWELQVRALDLADNTDQTPASCVFNILAIDPCDPDEVPPDTFIVAGCADPPAGEDYIEFTFDGSDPNDCTLPEDLTWQYRLFFNGPYTDWIPYQSNILLLEHLDPGEWEIHVKAVDEADNMDLTYASCVFNITIDPCNPDTDPPDTFLITDCEDPPPGVFDVEFELYGSDPHDCTPDYKLLFEYRLYQNGELHTSWTLLADNLVLLKTLEPTVWEFQARAIDKTGLVDPSPVVCVFQIEIDPCDPDNDPPETYITSGCDDPPVGEDYMQINLDGSDPNGCTPSSSLDYQARVSFDGSPFGSWYSLPGTAWEYDHLDHGDYIVQVRAVDNKNNCDPTPAECHFTICIVTCDETEPNNETADADVITPGCFSLGDMCGGDHVDVWGFQLDDPADFSIFLEFTENTSGDFSIVLTDAVSGIVWSDFDADSPIDESISLDSSKYFLMLMGSTGSCFEYEFTVDY